MSKKINGLGALSFEIQPLITRGNPSSLSSQNKFMTNGFALNVSQGQQSNE